MRKSYGFTLIELLVVMLLMGLIMSLTLPAFNRMIRGNRVDQLASNLKLGLEQAQSHAVRTRRHVALVLPNDREQWKEDELKSVQPFSHGGFRLAYVKANDDGKSWDFVRWVQGQEWKNAPDGAMLVRVMKQRIDSKGDKDYNKYKEGDAIKDVAKKVNSDNEFDPLAKLTNLKYDGTSSGDKPVDVEHCLIVFSPYGSLESGHDLRLVIAEALPVGERIVYPTQEAGGSDDNPLPVNWKMLSINKFSGRVEYYPVLEEEKK